MRLFNLLCCQCFPKKYSDAREKLLGNKESEGPAVASQDQLQYTIYINCPDGTKHELPMSGKKGSGKKGEQTIGDVKRLLKEKFNNEINIIATQLFIHGEEDALIDKTPIQSLIPETADPADPAVAQVDGPKTTQDINLFMLIDEKLEIQTNLKRMLAAARDNLSEYESKHSGKPIFLLNKERAQKMILAAQKQLHLTLSSIFLYINYLFLVIRKNKDSDSPDKFAFLEGEIISQTHELLHEAVKSERVSAALIRLTQQTKDRRGPGCSRPSFLITDMLKSLKRPNREFQNFTGNKVTFDNVLQVMQDEMSGFPRSLSDTDEMERIIQQHDNTLEKEKNGTQEITNYVNSAEGMRTYIEATMEPVNQAATHS